MDGDFLKTAVDARSRQHKREQVYLYTLTFLLLAGTVTGLAMLSSTMHYDNKQPGATLPQVIDGDYPPGPVSLDLAQPEATASASPAALPAAQPPAASTKELNQQVAEIVDALAFKSRREYVQDLLAMSQKLLKIQDIIGKLPRSQSHEHANLKRELQQLDREAARSMSSLKLHRGAQTQTHTDIMSTIAVQSEQQYMIHYQVLMDLNVFSGTLSTDEQHIRSAKQDLSRANELGIASFRQSDELFK